MAKSCLRPVTPTTVLRTVMPRRPPTFAALQTWNAAPVYQQATAVIGRQIDGRERQLGGALKGYNGAGTESINMNGGRHLVTSMESILQGEGGEVLYPVPWAREPSISYLVTPEDMKSLLVGAGFKLMDIQDSTEESQAFFERMTARMAKTGSPPVAWRLFLGDDFPIMARNQVRNMTERRIRTVSYICAA